jgi:hypothetical protein
VTNDDPNRGACCEADPDLLRTGLSETALALSVNGFQALWQGRAVRPDELVHEDPKKAIEAAEFLARHGRAELDDQGRLVGIHGLTLRPTRHHIDHNGDTHSTWCAFDAVGIPTAASLDARAVTACPTCGRTLTVSIRAGTSNQAGTVLWLPQPATGHLMREFCTHANLYCSLDHLHETVDASVQPGRAVDLPTALALGSDTWSDIRGLEFRAGQ